MIKGVIFDMDGLMFDTERMWAPLWAPACESLGLAAPGEDFIRGAMGLAGENMLRHIEKYYPGTDASALLNSIWQIGAEHFEAGVPVKPGLPELVACLDDAAIPYLVASSSPRPIVMRNLKTTGFDANFKTIVSGDDVKYSKPNPAIFLLAAQKLGLPAEQCLVLEDSYNGVRAGHASGAVTVMVPDIMPPTDEMHTLADAFCEDLFGVKKLLQEGKL